MPTCTQTLETRGVEIKGLSKSESASVICSAARYCAGYPSHGQLSGSLVKSMLTSRFGDALSKSVVGGLQHVVSVDNGASYAELWHKGGNWYAVTGGQPTGGPTVDKGGIYEIAGVVKGMPAPEATTRFLEAVFGPSAIGKGGCGCGK